MKLLLTLTAWHVALGRLLDKLQPLALLAGARYWSDSSCSDPGGYPWTPGSSGAPPPAPVR